MKHHMSPTREKQRVKSHESHHDIQLYLCPLYPVILSAWSTIGQLHLYLFLFLFPSFTEVGSILIGSKEGSIWGESQSDQPNISPCPAFSFQKPMSKVFLGINRKEMFRTKYLSNLGEGKWKEENENAWMDHLWHHQESFQLYQPENGRLQGGNGSMVWKGRWD